MQKHPYTKYVSHQAWEVLNLIIKDLKNNKDIELLTKDEYVIGYILKNLEDNDLLNIKALTCPLSTKTDSGEKL